MAKTKEKKENAEVTEETVAKENTAPKVEQNATSFEVQNPIQMLDIFNQAVQLAHSKGTFTLEDSELIAKAKRFGTGFKMKEQLKVNFNNSFFKQVEKTNEQGKKVYNFEPVELDASDTASRDVKVYNITEEVLFFANDQVYVAKNGDTVIEFNGALFLEVTPTESE